MIHRIYKDVIYDDILYTILYRANIKEDNYRHSIHNSQASNMIIHSMLYIENLLYHTQTSCIECQYDRSAVVDKGLLLHLSYYESHVDKVGKRYSAYLSDITCYVCDDCIMIYIQ
jgi:hypothetical protein